MSNKHTIYWNIAEDTEPFDDGYYLVKFKYKSNGITGSTVAYLDSEGWIKTQPAYEPALPDYYLLEARGLIVTHWADLP